MAVKISSIENMQLRQIAQQADKNNDGKLKRNEYSVFAKESEKAGLDYTEINKALDMNGFQRWWYDVDKISTDGNDDGKLTPGQYALSFVKGLIGGLPKAMIKHPISTAVTLGACAGLTALTGGAILPVLTAVGIATGVGMAGVGTYKALTAKTDGEAKQALETMGMGVTTTAMSMLAAGKALKIAEKAGVKSAHVGENANIFQKTIQTFKSIPESFTKSVEWGRFNLNLPVSQKFDALGRLIKNEYGNSYKEYQYGDDVFRKPLGKKSRYLSEELTPGGTKNTYELQNYRTIFTKKDYSILVKSELADGSVKEYEHMDIIGESDYSYLKSETRPDGTKIKYRATQNYYTGHYKQSGIETIDAPDGTHICYSEDGLFKNINYPDGSKKVLYRNQIVEETLPDGKTTYSYHKLKQTPKGTDTRNYSDGTIEAYYPNRRCIRYNSDGSIKSADEWVYDYTSPQESSTTSSSSSSIDFELSREEQIAQYYDSFNPDEAWYWRHYGCSKHEYTQSAGGH